MKKFYKAQETKKNTWKKRTCWQLEGNDIAAIALVVLVVGFVTVRCLIG